MLEFTTSPTAPVFLTSFLQHSVYLSQHQERVVVEVLKNLQATAA
jgi:hypothetical protein